MEVMKMAAGDDYKDDDDDDDGHGGGGGEYSPTNRSEHSYELYVGEGAERQAAGSGLQPHRRMSVFTEEDEEEAALAAAAMGAEQQEGRDRRVSQCQVKRDAPSGVPSTRSLILPINQSDRLWPFLEMESPSVSSLARWWARSRSLVRASECGRPELYIHAPFPNSAVTTVALSPVPPPPF